MLGARSGSKGEISRRSRPMPPVPPLDFLHSARARKRRDEGKEREEGHSKRCQPIIISKPETQLTHEVSSQPDGIFAREQLPEGCQGEKSSATGREASIVKVQCS